MQASTGKAQRFTTLFGMANRRVQARAFVARFLMNLIELEHRLFGRDACANLRQSFDMLFAWPSDPERSLRELQPLRQASSDRHRQLIHSRSLKGEKGAPPAKHLAREALTVIIRFAGPAPWRPRPFGHPSERSQRWQPTGAHCRSSAMISS
ncbi:hypothetical protein GmRootV118_13600 [Variovorax sp. V118]